MFKTIEIRPVLSNNKIKIFATKGSLNNDFQRHGILIPKKSNNHTTLESTQMTFKSFSFYHDDGPLVLWSFKVAIFFLFFF